MSGAVPLIPLCAFMVWSGKNLLLLSKVKNYWKISYDLNKISSTERITPCNNSGFVHR
jgi:hypothetical protein